ncbi:copper-binding protein [Massilia sp. LC238]|uniref:copper-binding protein n=1 Tax=Massilia sp. LC238 TaxID=1502852 RepID=UPI0004E2C0A9|nr:copper-binding protein [Massilia sp. LC238]KFC66598.1 Cation efflux system protein cusF [Massilia sp. LC238]
MKRHTMIAAMLALAVSGLGAAQAQPNQTGMNAQQANKGAKATPHETIGTVKSVNPAAGTVTLAHGPVKSLNWPAMTMGFAVKDKDLFDKLSVGKKVDVEFVQQDSKYVITAVK